MLRRLVHLVGLVVVLFVAAAAAAFGGFVAWRRSGEAREDAAFRAHVRLQDGPHATWVDGERLRIARAWFDPHAGRYAAVEQTLPCQAAAAAAAAIDPNATIDCQPAEPRIPATASARVVAAISDVHGHYNHLARLLQSAGVVDGQLDWAFGANHLVIAGDILDKGPEITRALWLVKKLERQARDAGGHLHFLLGNHEYLALTGRSRISDRKYIELTSALGVAYPSLFSPATELGRWIRGHGVAVRINDTLFVHAGLSPDLVARGVPIDRLNKLARESLSTDGLRAWSPEDLAVTELIWGRQGVTSYRAYFDRSLPLGFWRALRGDLRENRAATATLAAGLDRYGSRRIVVGHTETRRILKLFEGRLVAICQRMAEFDHVDPEARAELLLIEGGRLTGVTAGGMRRPL